MPFMRYNSSADIPKEECPCRDQEKAAVSAIIPGQRASSLPVTASGRTL